MTLGHAKKLRTNMTDAERRLWYRLRAHRFGGHKFKRQVPIGPYVVDFACMGRRLVVEVDGGQHADSANDSRRDAFLRRNGFEVLRFWNNDVLLNMDGVLTVIAELHPSPGAPEAGAPPSPSGGEGVRASSKK